MQIEDNITSEYRYQKTNTSHPVPELKPKSSKLKQEDSASSKRAQNPPGFAKYMKHFKVTMDEIKKEILSYPEICAEVTSSTTYICLDTH